MEGRNFSISIIIIFALWVRSSHHALYPRENTTCSEDPRVIHYWLSGNIESTNESLLYLNSPRLTSTTNSTITTRPKVTFNHTEDISRNISFDQLIHSLTDPCVAEVTLDSVRDSLCNDLDLIAFTFNKPIKTSDCTKYWTGPKGEAGQRARLVPTGESWAEVAFHLANSLRQHRLVAQHGLHPHLLHLDSVSWPFDLALTGKRSSIETEQKDNLSNWFTFVGNVLSREINPQGLHQSASNRGKCLTMLFIHHFQLATRGET